VTSRCPPFTLAALLLLLPFVTAAMEGRGSGPPGGDRATRYIADVLPRAGLRPAGDAGSFARP